MVEECRVLVVRDNRGPQLDMCLAVFWLLFKIEDVYNCAYGEGGVCVMVCECEGGEVCGEGPGIELRMFSYNCVCVWGA